MNWAESKQDLEVPFAGYDKRNEPINSLDVQQGSSLEAVLIIYGSQSTFCSEGDMKELKGKNKKLIELHEVEGGKGGDSNFKTDKTAYFKAIKEFLE